MKLRLKFLFISLIFSQLIYAQVDSSDFSFTSTNITNNESHELNLSFNFNVITSYSRFSIDVIAINSELIESVVYSEIFIVSDLQSAQYYSNGNVSIQLGTVASGLEYIAVIHLLDSLGHQVVINESITL